jgi:CspA family cold shock protein
MSANRVLTPVLLAALVACDDRILMQQQSRMRSRQHHVLGVSSDTERRMTREKRPDELAREAAPEPTEPLFTQRTTIGVVKWWRDTKGHGVIAASEIAPWDIWCHFSAIEGSGYRELKAGERVEVDYYRANQESFKYIAQRVRRLDPPNIPSADDRSP